MKQLLILSGKGGTGKTTVTGAFISMSEAKAYADCDVDAPNLHLLMDYKNKPKTKDFYGMKKSKIDYIKCTSCGKCMENCRFDAISFKEKYVVDKYLCEGCSVCEYLCPSDAISMVDYISGELFLYKDERVFSTAKLKMGSGNSGLLVSDVKKELKENAPICDIAIIDGSPGIGCPVTASISGVDMVLVVAEPSISGMSDMKRILKTIDIFQVGKAVCINKFDTNKEISKEIIKYCKINKVPYVGKISYDKAVHKATNEGVSIADIPCKSGREVKKIFMKTYKILTGKEF